MSIRITGMYSGLDTESIINELASAQSYKKEKLVKKQKSFSWKMDAWKALNTKVYSFYQKLDDLRFQSNYIKKKTTVSDSNAVRVESGADTVDGVHTMTVKQLAKRAYLTGGSIAQGNTHFRENATLGRLGMDAGTTGKISITGANGASAEINVSADMKISEFVTALKNTGLNASFDETNQRLFISSKDTGELAGFSITGDDANGFKALEVLGLLSGAPAAGETKSAEYQEYEKWANYYSVAGDDSDLAADVKAEKDALIQSMAEARAKAYKAQDDALTKANEELDKANVTNQEKLEELDGYATYGSMSKDDLYDKIYGEEVEVDKKDDEGNVVMQDGQPVKEKVRQNGLTQELEDLKKDLAEKQKEGSGASEADIQAAKDAVAAKEKEITDAKNCYSFVSAIAANNATKQKNQDTLDAHAGTYTVTDDTVAATAALEATITAEVNTKAEASKDALAALSSIDPNKMAHKIDGQNAKIVLNGVEYENYSNSITVNGMTITALEQTDKEITLSTATDTDAVYDMVKSVLTAYNELIGEMDTLYNAESSAGYDPLSSEEKEALSDDEVEEWEKKIKDALLRRDSQLSSVASSMKNVMLQGVTVNGRKMYLSDFGVNTLGYFNTKENERSLYHIDGDPDDASTKGNTDVLRSMIATDPDTVAAFFSGLANNMHDELFKKMSATKLSSALTVYNDKQMKEEYDSYTEKIKKEEDKLNALMDKWYAKFSAMETALAKMESKNNSLASLFGG
ncbi:MAG: flagellar filament capping protein FliD [Bacteroidales bacterium]|nr:flagellar filament capping protein FliD [Bacteroidales bacterium]MCM1415889.1 flagellar filament capping protein FliD [bacterium]MCM1422681.1 flagellar filament capping protein FliD [bacterium]